MWRNEDHFAFERFSLNLCKLSSLNVRIAIFSFHHYGGSGKLLISCLSLHAFFWDVWSGELNIILVDSQPHPQPKAGRFHLQQNFLEWSRLLTAHNIVFFFIGK